MTSLKLTTVAAALALTAIGITAASAKPIFQPVNPGMKPIGGPSQYQSVPSFKPIGKPSGGCPGGMVGCNPNTWTPGSHHGHWGHGWGYGGGINVSLAAVAPSGDCYYTHRKVYVSGVGIVRERVLVCD